MKNLLLRLSKGHCSATFRPLMEELELRDLPNAASALSTLATHIERDVASVNSDLSVIANVPGVSGNATLTSALKNVSADLSAAVGNLAGGNLTLAVSHLNAAIRAGATLKADLSRVLHVTPSIRKDLNHLHRDLTGLLRDVKTISTDTAKLLTRIRSDMTALTRTLSSNPNAAVATTLSSLESNLSAVYADLAAGKSAVSDLNLVVGDELALAQELANSANRNVHHELSHLRNDLHRLSNNLNQIEQAVDVSLAYVRSDIAVVASDLASNTNSTVAAALKAVQIDLTPILIDIKTGAAVGGDLTTLIKDVNTLESNVASGATFIVANDLNTLQRDLLGLAVDVAAMTVTTV